MKVYGSYSVRSIECSISDDKKIKDLEKQMMEVIRQYEERVQKMRVLVEESEKKSKQTINELKSKQLDRETLTTLLNSVIDERYEHHNHRNRSNLNKKQFRNQRK